MVLREIFVKLGLDTDQASFAKGQLAAKAIEVGLGAIVNAARNMASNLSDAFIGFNARAEQAKMGLAGIAGMNLKLPWEEAKKAADELYAGLQEDAAKTPAETTELVDFAQQIAGAYLAAGKNMKDLRQFTTQAVVAAKMLRAEGTAATDIKQAIQGRVGVKDMFAQNVISTLGMTIAQFNAKSMQERADLFAQGLNNPTIRAAMEDYEGQWDSITSTIKDNVKIIAGEVGKPLFELLKRLLKRIGTWIQTNKGAILRFFVPIGEAFKFLANNIDNVALVLKGLAAAFVLFNIASVAAATKAAAAWLIAAAPFAAIAAAIALVLLFLDDIKRFREGRDSLFGEWAKTIADWLKPNANDPWWVRSAKELVKYFAEALDIAKQLGLVDESQTEAGRNRAAANDRISNQSTYGGFLHRQANRLKRGADMITGGPIDWRDRANARGEKAIADTGSYWEGVKATLGFGAYGNYTPSSGGGMQQNYVTVNAAPGQSAEDIGKIVVDKINENWDTKMQEAAE